MISTLDAKTLLYALKNWALERIENNLDVTVVSDDHTIIIWSHEWDNAWKEFHKGGYNQWERTSSKENAIEAVKNACAIVV